jgi:flagellar capping protein FliD
MKKLFFLALIVLTSCSPLDDYISAGEFSENVRKIEKMHGDQYAEQDIETLKKAVFIAERENATLFIEQATYREALESIKHSRLSYQAAMSDYQKKLYKWEEALHGVSASIVGISEKGDELVFKINAVNDSESPVEKLGVKVSKGTEGHSVTQLYDLKSGDRTNFSKPIKAFNFGYENRYELTMPMMYHLEITYYQGPLAPEGMFPPVKPENPLATL